MDYPTPSPDTPQPPTSRGRIQSQSAHRSAREEMKDILAEINELYKIARMT